MNRVRISKIQYVILFITLLVIFQIVVFRVFKDNKLMGASIMCLLFLIPGRLQGYFYKDFYIGRRLVKQNDLLKSLNHFEKFLADVRKNGWKKKLIWLSWGMYSKDIEAMALNNMGTIYLKLGKLQEAQEYCELAIKVDCKYPIPFYNLALIFVVLGDEDKAKEYLKQSIDLGYSGTSFDKLVQKGQDLASFIDGR